MSVDAHPRSSKIGLNCDAEEVSEVEKSEETKRNTKRKDRLREYRMKWFRRDSIPRPSVKMKVKHENVKSADF